MIRGNVVEEVDADRPVAITDVDVADVIAPMSRDALDHRPGKIGVRIDEQKPVVHRIAGDNVGEQRRLADACLAENGDMAQARLEIECDETVLDDEAFVGTIGA
jgi:hypothetical protein